MPKRKKVKIKDGVLIALIVAVFALIVILSVILFKINDENKKDENDNNSSKTTSASSAETKDENISSTDNSSSNESSSKDNVESKPEKDDKPTSNKLDADFGRLLLINGKNALPKDYDTKVREYLVEIDDEYRNNDNVTQIHRDIYPYITAMIAAAQAEGVDLQVWSPFRSYAIQNDLFQKQVQRVGGDEDKAATVVARPGTSEHNTGLCADFNRADDSFENTPMFTWMCENAEDYGFILRYPKEKQHITGVIYESWHWRFVGINNAKEMNKLGVTLEEFIEMKGLDPAMDMYGDDSQNQ